MPTTPINVYSVQKLEPLFDPDTARQRAAGIAPSLTIARGTLLGEITASPGVYSPYASTHTDGTQVPKLICAYDITTDASSNVTLSATAGQTGAFAPGDAGKTVPAYVCGTFRTTDLTGLDATAVTALGARFEQGSLSAGGIVRIP